MTPRYRNFFIRPVSWVSDLSVYADSVTPDDLPKDMAYFFELYQDCFQHHVQSRLQSAGNELTAIADESRKRKVQQDALTAYFLKKIYIPNNISYSTNSSAIDQKKHERTFSELMEDVTGNPLEIDFPERSNRPGTNRVNFLIGDVGVGKSLLTSKLISEIESGNKTKSPDKYHLLPIYLDFELLLKSENDSFNDIEDSFVDMIVDAITSALEKDEQWRPEYSDALAGTPYQKFIRLNFKLLRSKIRLFLIFDNTDRYHFHYSKYSFYEPYRKEQTLKVKRNFGRIFSLISRVEKLGDQGLAILFVCRKAVLKYWVASGRPEDNHRSLIKDYGVYQIAKIDEIDALRSRFKLAEAAIDAIEKRQEKKSLDYLKHLKLIEEKLEASFTHRGPNSLNLIRQLTHHGTRSFIDFLGAIRLDFRTQYDLVLRLFEEQPYNLLRLYITNLNKRFAQFTNHFPNLFLVDAVIAPTEEFKQLHQGHKQTYWLKYLVLKYITTRHSAGEITTYNELKERFVDACGYEPHLFDLVLGSLNAVNSFRCIEIDEDSVGLGDCLRVRPTLRGKTLLSHADGVEPHAEFCFDFNYLQFVVDDPQLSLPEPWARNVFVDADIGYMLSAAPVYRSGLGNYLSHKSKSVLYFLHVLRRSGRYEITTRLRHDQDVANLMPDFDKLFKTLFSTYQLILVDHVMKGTEALASLNELHKSLSNNSQLDNFYGSFVDSNCLVEPS